MDQILKHIKALAEPGRLRTIALISRAGEMCVQDLHQILATTFSTASRNLRMLEEAGWLDSRRDGRWIYYRLSELDYDWSNLLDTLLGRFEESAVAVGDIERLHDSAGNRVLNV